MRIGSGKATEIRAATDSSSRRERKKIAQGEVRRGGRNPGLVPNMKPVPEGRQNSCTFSWFQVEDHPWLTAVKIAFISPSALSS